MRHGVRKLVAFGSRARGDARPDSDLDLAAAFPKRAPPLALQRVIAKEGVVFGS